MEHYSSPQLHSRIGYILVLMLTVMFGACNQSSGPNNGPQSGGPPGTQNWTFILWDTINSDVITIYSRTNMRAPAKRLADICMYTTFNGAIESHAYRTPIAASGSILAGNYTHSRTADCDLFETDLKFAEYAYNLRGSLQIFSRVDTLYLLETDTGRILASGGWYTIAYGGNGYSGSGPFRLYGGIRAIEPDLWFPVDLVNQTSDQMYYEMGYISYLWGYIDGSQHKRFFFTRPTTDSFRIYGHITQGTINPRHDFYAAASKAIGEDAKIIWTGDTIDYYGFR